MAGLKPRVFKSRLWHSSTWFVEYPSLMTLHVSQVGPCWFMRMCDSWQEAIDFALKVRP